MARISRKRTRSPDAGAWPCTSSYQEKFAGFPAIVFSIVSAARVIGQAILSSVIWPPWTPSSPNCRVWMTPRSDGSPASTCTRRCACVSMFICEVRSAVDSNNSPCCAKNAPPLGCSIERNRSFCCDRRCVSALAAPATSSTVGALTTATISSKWGNAFSISASRCRHEIFGEMSWLTSVVILKCVTAYQDDSTPSRTERMITGAA